MLTLDKPPVNALGRELVDALGSTLSELREDSSARCLIVRSGGNHFCAGADLNDWIDITPSEARRFSISVNLVPARAAAAAPAGASCAAKSRSHASNWRSTALRASATLASKSPAALTPAIRAVCVRLAEMVADQRHYLAPLPEPQESAHSAVLGSIADRLRTEPVTTGIDDNHDSIFNDRPVMTPRNGERYP